MKRRIALILIMVCTFVGGCNKNESVKEVTTNYEKTIEKKDIEIKGLKKKIEEMKNEIEVLSKKTSTDESKSIDGDNRISIAGIRLGYKMEQVAEILGTDYIEEEWIYYEEPNIKWVYKDGLIIYFNSEKVHNIDLTSSERRTDFGVTVGSSAKDAIDKCSKKYKEYVSMHSFDKKPNLGWYYTDNDELLILHLNPNGDRFNKDIVVNEDIKIEKIELAHESSFD